MATPSHLVLPHSPTRPTGQMYQPPQPHSRVPGWVGQQYPQSWMPQPDPFSMPQGAPQYNGHPQYAAPQYAPPPQWGGHPQQHQQPHNTWNHFPAHADVGQLPFTHQQSPYPDISMHAGPLVGRVLTFVYGSIVRHNSSHQYIWHGMIVQVQCRQLSIPQQAQTTSSRILCLKLHKVLCSDKVLYIDCVLMGMT